MLKVTLKPLGSYAEESQPNPLTWYILRRTGDTEFENISAPIICKDFFNDLAYTLQTKDAFGIYGFHAGQVGEGLSKDKPVYMLLQNTTPQFQQNIASVLNPWLLEFNLPLIGMVETKDGFVISFEPIYFSNTYYISLVSLIIRLLNIKHQFNSMQEVIKYKKFPAKDQNKWNQVVAKNVFFAIPEKLKKYVFYVGEKYNNLVIKKGDYQLPNLVHNNGVLSWSEHL